MQSLGKTYLNSYRFAPVLFLFYICKKLILYLMKNLNTLAVGAIGTGGVELAQQINFPEIEPNGSAISLVIQIVIAIATLFKMFKKPKGV
jgi:hypothetical protein